MSSKAPQYKYLALIVALYVTFAQVSYVLAYKMVSISLLILPAGVIVFPLIYTISDIVTEVYGYQRARRMLWETAACGLIFSMAITLLIHLPSPHAKLYHEALGEVWRIYFAIIVGVTIGAFVNIYVFSKWKIRAKGRFFWFRSFVSTSIGDAVITIIVDSIAFVGVMPAHKVMVVILTIFLFKVAYAFIAAIPAAYIARFLKKAENLDVYDFSTNFNPFKMSLDDQPVINSQHR